MVNVAKWLDLYEVYSDDLLFIYDDRPKAEYPFDILVDDAPVNLVSIKQPKLGIIIVNLGIWTSSGLLG